MIQKFLRGSPALYSKLIGNPSLAVKAAAADFETASIADLTPESYPAAFINLH
jgi:hypothetical protein